MGGSGLETPHQGTGGNARGMFESMKYTIKRDVKERRVKNAIRAKSVPTGRELNAPQ